MCLCDQNLVTVAFLLEKLSQPQLYKNLTRKTAFLRGGLCSSSIIWDWHQVQTYKPVWKKGQN